MDTLKITVLIDTADQAILAVACSAKWPNDAKVGPQLAARNMDQMKSLAADKESMKIPRLSPLGVNE